MNITISEELRAYLKEKGLSGVVLEPAQCSS